MSTDKSKLSEYSQRRGASPEARESQLSALLQAFDGLMYICSSDYHIEYMNADMIKRVGHDPTGERCYEAIHNFSEPCAWCTTERVVQGETVDWELRSPKDGRWYHIVNTPVNNPDGSMSKLALVRDITERKLIEEQLQESEAKYRLLVENQSNVVIKVNMDGTLTFISPSFLKTFGGSEADHLGRKFEDYIHPDDLAAAQKAMESLAVSPHKVMLDTRWRDKDGAWRWYSWIGNLMSSGKKGEQEVVGVGRDITDRKETEEELARAKRFMDAALNTLEEPFFVKDEKHCWVMLNDAACKAMGRTREELLGKTDRDLFPKEQADAFHAGDHYVLKHGRDIREEEMTWQGKTRIILTSKYAYDEPDTGKRYIVGTVRDITDRKRHEEDLAQANERLEERVGERTRQLEEANEALQKDMEARRAAESALVRAERMAAVGTLAGGVAHEFNNINTSILGFVELLLEDPTIVDPQREFLERVRRASVRAANITKNLLTFAGTTYSQQAMNSLVETVEEALGLLSRAFMTSGITLQRALHEVPKTLFDSGQIAQVILNLLINAQHALTGREEKVISVITEADEAWVYLHVKDTGCGIPPEALPRIFTPFYSTKGEHAGEVGPQSRVSGTGLGLSVSHTIMTRHNGSISVESEPNLGTTFTLKLPIVCESKEAAEENASASNAVQASPGRILVIDDEDDTRSLLTLALGRHGHHVEATDHGEEALQKIRTEGFDVVLLDLQMCFMSGEEILRRLQDNPPTSMPHILVITGRSTAQVQKALASMPVHAMVQKPFELSEIEAAVNEALLARRESAENS